MRLPRRVKRFEPQYHRLGRVPSPRAWRLMARWFRRASREAERQPGRIPLADLQLLKRFKPDLRPDKFVLDAAGRPVPEPDLFVWAMWQEVFAHRRRVARTKVHGGEVSTVFLGLDHRFSFSEGEAAAPVLYETMFFGETKQRGEIPRCYGGERATNVGEAKMNHAMLVHELGGAV